MTKEVLKVNKDKEELQRLKEKNNPFFVAFQSLNLEFRRVLLMNRPRLMRCLKVKVKQ